jgi:hypothetical protein
MNLNFRAVADEFRSILNVFSILSHILRVLMLPLKRLRHDRRKAGKEGQQILKADTLSS